MNRQTSHLKKFAKVCMRTCLVISFLMVGSACDFIENSSKNKIPKDNPGINADLFEGNAAGPEFNSHRMLSAQRQTQNCSHGTSCAGTQQNSGLIEYSYNGSFLDAATESESGPGSDVVSYRKYFYSASNPNRLDKVAVASNGTSNFHTLHDYTYDDEDDPSDFLSDVDDVLDADPNNDGDGFNAIALARPKLRLEYICDIDLDETDASNASCDRLSAREVIRYVYYADGRLYRKEFDVDNDTEIEHQKIYRYRNNMLERVDTDNFYNGLVDERYSYALENFGLETPSMRLFIDNGFVAKQTRGVDRTVSYILDNGLVVRECYFFGELDGSDRINNEVPTGDCTLGSAQQFHWIFEWEESNCWAGGLDDIDPEARAIDFLCKQGG